MKQSTAEVKIEVGSVIRSHDFWPCGDRPDSYMEGVVLAMDVGSFQNPSGSGMVEFKVTRRVFGGVERPEEIGTVARAPLPFEIGDGLFGDWAGRIDDRETHGNVGVEDHIKQAMNNIFGHEGRVTVSRPRMSIPKGPCGNFGAVQAGRA